MRVMWIPRKHKHKTYRYPFIVSSYRNENGKARNKIHFKLHGLPDHVIEAIDQTLRGGGDLRTVLRSEIQFEQAKEIGASWAVVKIMEQLGVLKQLNRVDERYRPALVSMIVDRVTNDKPYSTRVLHSQFEDRSINRILGYPEPGGLESWYHALEDIYAHQTEIQKSLFAERKYKGKRIVLYDISSSYVEGNKCPLAAFGYNRDQKKGKKQIVYGVITDEDGCPIGIKVFNGNTKDETTVLDQIRELKTDFGIKEVIFVGDRGMMSAHKIDAVKGEEFQKWIRYITAIKRSEMMRMVEDETHPMQIGLFDQNELVEVQENESRYVLCHNPLKKEEDSETRERLLKKTGDKLLSIYNQVQKGRLKNKDKITKRVYRWINKWNMERFFTVEYGEGLFSFQRDENKIKHYAKLDGCYVVTTNIENNQIATDEIVSRYKSLAKVEQVFRTMKTTEIMVRPIRKWNPERVKGHMFICFLAYLIIWEVRQKLHEFLERDRRTHHCVAGSLREIWDDLKKIQIAAMTIGKSTEEQISSISQYQRQLLQALGVPITRSKPNALSLRT